jgi:hypothetical protein
VGRGERKRRKERERNGTVGRLSLSIFNLIKQSSPPPTVISVATWIGEGGARGGGHLVGTGPIG